MIENGCRLDLNGAGFDLRQRNQIAKMRFDGKTYTDELFVADKYNQFVEESILKLIKDKDKNNSVTYPHLDEGEQTQEFLSNYGDQPGRYN